MLDKEKKYLLSLFCALVILILMILVKNRCGKTEKYRSNSQKILILVVGEKDMYEYKQKYDVIEFHSSPEVTPGGWNQIVKTISSLYQEYDAFVIVHNPETITYTASALSFLLENLNKTVVITEKDIRESIKLASNYCIPEVLIYNNSKILRGCRCKKYKDVIISPNFPFLGKKQQINDELLLEHPKEPFRPKTVDINKQIVIIKLFPGIDADYLESIIKGCRIYGIILESYNIGYISLANRFITKIKEIVQGGIIVANVSQDMNPVMDGTLESVGVIPCSSMTTESVFAKLSLIVSNVKYDQYLVSQLMKINMRGEL